MSGDGRRHVLALHDASEVLLLQEVQELHRGGNPGLGVGGQAELHAVATGPLPVRRDDADDLLEIGLGCNGLMILLLQKIFVKNAR